MCGGGAFNPNITEFIQQNYPKCELTLRDRLLTCRQDNDARRGRCPGGGQRSDHLQLAGNGSRMCNTKDITLTSQLVGRSIPVPNRVETRDPYVLGKVSPGANYRDVMRRGMAFGGEENVLPPVRQLIVKRKGKLVTNIDL